MKGREGVCSSARTALRSPAQGRLALALARHRISGGGEEGREGERGERGEREGEGRGMGGRGEGREGGREGKNVRESGGENKNEG